MKYKVSIIMPVYGVEDYIDQVVSAGIDAFIVSDPFIISFIKNKYPNIEIVGFYLQKILP